MISRARVGAPREQVRAGIRAGRRRHLGGVHAEIGERDLHLGGAQTSLRRPEEQVGDRGGRDPDGDGGARPEQVRRLQADGGHGAQADDDASGIAPRPREMGRGGHEHRRQDRDARGEVDHGRTGRPQCVHGVRRVRPGQGPDADRARERHDGGRRLVDQEAPPTPAQCGEQDDDDRPDGQQRVGDAPQPAEARVPARRGTCRTRGRRRTGPEPPG